MPEHRLFYLVPDCRHNVAREPIALQNKWQAGFWRSKILNGGPPHLRT